MDCSSCLMWHILRQPCVGLAAKAFLMPVSTTLWFAFAIVSEVLLHNCVTSHCLQCFLSQETICVLPFNGHWQLWSHIESYEVGTLAVDGCGCYVWYSEDGTGRGCSPPRPLLAVPNVTAPPINVQCTNHRIADMISCQCLLVTDVQCSLSAILSVISLPSTLHVRVFCLYQMDNIFCILFTNGNAFFLNFTDNAIVLEC